MLFNTKHVSKYISIIFIIIINLAYTQSSLEIFQKGLYQENGAGNLEEAIKIYNSITKDGNADKSLRANAQLHIGICYEKIKIAKAKKAYQNVLENFADQQDIVAEAHKRLERFEPESEFSHINPEAREAFIKAKHYSNMRNVHRVVDYYKQAIVLDSTFAQAYSGLAKIFAISGWMGLPDERMPIADDYARKAIEIDSNLSEAHAVLGMVRMWYYWDWVGAEKEYKQALELNPNDSETMQLYSILLSSQGRLEEALFMLEKALRLDPVNHLINESLGDYYAYRRDYDRAIEQYHKTLELKPQSSVTHVKLSNSYHKKNMVDEQIRSIKRYFLASRDTTLAETFVNTYIESGYKPAMLKWIESWQPYTTGQGVQASTIALVYMSIDEYDEAIKWLQKGYELHNKEMIMLGVRPLFDDLRSDDRFLELLDKIGLPH